MMDNKIFKVKKNKTEQNKKYMSRGLLSNKKSPIFNHSDLIEQSYELCGRGRGWEDLGEWH